MDTTAKENTIRPLPPPTHATGYKPPVQGGKIEPAFAKTNIDKLPAFSFSGNVEIVSDGQGNVTLTLKQH